MTSARGEPIAATRERAQAVRDIRASGNTPQGVGAGHTFAAGTVMYRVCIAIVDGSRARLFSYARAAELDGVREEFNEPTDLVNPAGGAQAERLDDDFAHSIVREIEHLLRAAKTQRLVLCASPSMLGDLRDAADQLSHEVTIKELPRDLGDLSLNQIREKLATYKLLPPVAPRIPMTV